MEYPDKKVKNAVEGFRGNIKKIYGDELMTIILYGSVVRGEFIKGKSDLNFIVVLKRVSLPQLKKALPYIRKWRKRSISPPLFLDPEYIRTSQDVFPIEFLTMKDAYEVLEGEDILGEMEITTKNLRHQCEREIKGYMLQVKEGYLEAGGKPKRLNSLLFSSFKSFVIVLKNLIRLHGEEPKRETYKVIEKVGELTGIALNAFKDIDRIRASGKTCPKGRIELVLSHYLDDIHALCEYIDRMEVKD